MVVVRRRCAAAGGLVVVDVQVCQVPAKRTMNHETARGCVSVLSCHLFLNLISMYADMWMWCP